MDYFCTHVTLYKRLTDSLAPFSLYQVVSHATHVSPNGTTSLIDLVFMPNLSQLRYCTVIPPLANSDHNGIQLELTSPMTTTRKPGKPKVVWKYAQADFEMAKFKVLIDSTNWDALLSGDVNVYSSCELDELDPPRGCPEEFLCTVEEVQWLLNRLDTTKSNGPDGISAKMLKAVAPSIALSIMKIFNLSLESACFPTMWKMANVVLVPKSNDHANPSKYRPISLLPILSKLLEHHIHFLLTGHLSSLYPISSAQWGFQSGKSTVTALLTSTHEWFQ